MCSQKQVGSSELASSLRVPSRPTWLGHSGQWRLNMRVEPPIGESLERDPSELLASAPILQSGRVTVPGGSDREGEDFIASLEDL